MYAVIKTGGKQYRVTEGETLRIEKLDSEVGSSVKFDQVLMVGEGEAVKVGAPILAGALVTAKVIEQDRAKKVLWFKLRRRKNYRRRGGHRQYFTAVRIEKITQGG